MADELRRSFHDGLHAVHEEVGGMVAEAGASVSLATRTLLEGNVTAAAEVVAAAEALGRRNAGVEREVLDLLALQGPVARDLRLLMASQRIAHEAELSGALAASVANRAGRLDPGVLTPRLRTLLYDLGAEAAELLVRAGQAYAGLDHELSCRVLGLDETVRGSHRRFLAELLNVREAPVESAVELGVVARCYERIADHAVEIAQRVRFVISPGTVTA